MNISKRVDVLRVLLHGDELHAYSRWMTPGYNTVIPSTMRKLYAGGYLVEVPVKDGCRYDEGLFTRRFKLNPKMMNEAKAAYLTEVKREERRRNEEMLRNEEVKN